jgi:hypothetical protein
VIQLNEMEVNSDLDLEILERRIARLEGQVQARQNSDNIIFAKIREDLDAALNKTKEDRIIITGITTKTVPPVDPEGRKNWIRGIVTDIFESVIPGFTGKILYVNQMKMKNQQLPMVEVKLDSAISAGSIRKAFAEKKKAGNDLGRTFISNSVNLATRVRVDILKALARKFRTPTLQPTRSRLSLGQLCTFVQLTKRNQTRSTRLTLLLMQLLSSDTC